MVVSRLPYPRSWLETIEAMLTSRNPIVHFDTQFSRYSLAAYFEHGIRDKCEYRALFDHNVVSYLLSLTKGDRADNNMRDVAALMAFVMAFDCVIDPRMYAIEYATHHGDETTRSKIALFRQADNIHPRHYAEIALAHRDRLSVSLLPEISEQGDSSFRHHVADAYWQQYAMLLKLGCIANSTRSPLQKMTEFMEWQRDDYLFSSPGILYAVMALGPRPIANPLKNHSADTPQKLLDGVRNTAWDVTIAKYWSDKVVGSAGSKHAWILCTMDKCVKKLASSLIASPAKTADTQLGDLLRAHWPPRLVGDVGQAIQSILHSADDPTRVATLIDRRKKTHSLINALEKEYTSK